MLNPERLNARGQNAREDRKREVCIYIYINIYIYGNISL
jgi:hypothetical protein